MLKRQKCNEVDLRKKWRAVQAAANMFWVRWTRKYLPLLSICKKWNLMLRNFNVPDLVLINIPDTQRSNWSLGRILENYQGTNDVARTEKMKTRNGEIIRPASKQALLEAVVEQTMYICHKTNNLVWFIGEGGCSDITELFAGY